MAIPRLAILKRGLRLAALIALAGCASTQMVNQWSDPAYQPVSLNRVVVLGVSKQAALRRSFEDEFVAQLKAYGIDALPSYSILPEDGQAGEARLIKAVKQSGADAAIITRLVRVERRTQVTPGYFSTYPTYGFHRGYASAWVGFYEPPRIYDYDVYTSETSLYDLNRDRLVWAGTAQTTDPGEIDKEIKNYVKVVIEALSEKHLMRAAQ